MREVRSGTSKVLLTTDLLSRGIDVQATNVIINYDVPNSPETYLHQVGRAGRFGRKGTAITLLVGGPAQLAPFSQQYKLVFDELPLHGDVFGHLGA